MPPANPLIGGRAHWLAALCLLALLWLGLLGVVRSGPRCASDEPQWITSGFLTLELVRELAGPERWATAYNERDLGHWGNMNPPVGKLVIGSLVALARRPDQPIDYQWELRLTYKQNRDAGNLPPRELLERVRLGMSLLGALALGLLYVLCLQVTGAGWLSLLAPLLLFAMPSFRFHATRVYADVPQLVFMLGALVLFNRFLRTGGRVVLVAAMASSGLAIAVKFSASPIVLAAGAFLLLRPGPWRRRMLEAALAVVVPFAVFCAANPFLYPNPVSRTWLIISAWSKTLADLRRGMYYTRPATSSTLDSLVLTSQRTLAAPELEVVSAAASGIALALAACALAAALVFGILRSREAIRRSVRGRGLLAGGSALLALAGAFTGAGPGAALLVLGCASLLLDVPRAPDPWSRERRLFLLTAFGATWLVTGLWLPLDLPRYYLRLLVLLPVIYAAGVGWLVALLRRAPG